MSNQFTNPWTPDQLSFLKQNYQMLAMKELIEGLGRTRQAIIMKASDLQIRRKPEPKFRNDYLKETLAYLAGIIDGEGCIGLIKGSPLRKGLSGNHYYVRLSIVNTEKCIIDWLQNNFFGNVVSQVRKNPKYKTKYHWYLGGKYATKLLALCLPYLKIKKTQAELAILYQKTIVNNKRDMLYIPKQLLRIRDDLRLKMSNRHW